MKFNAWSKKRILEGKKRLTSRKVLWLDDPDVISVGPPMPWWFIRDYLYKDEGAESPEELQRVINGIFRREVKDPEEFWVYVLDTEKIIERFAK